MLLKILEIFLLILLKKEKLTHIHVEKTPYQQATVHYATKCKPHMLNKTIQTYRFTRNNAAWPVSTSSQLKCYLRVLSNHLLEVITKLYQALDSCIMQYN